MNRTALAILFALAACGGSFSNGPLPASEVGTLYDIGGDNLSCYSTATMAISADTAICVWSCATVDAAPYRDVTVRFIRNAGVWVEFGRSRSTEPGC